MGALLSQAVANQLRQYPQSLNPRPSPPTLIQQVLNQPGPSRPTWMAPVMENRQLLEESMAPGPYQQALNQALTRGATGAALSFGPGITKEEREAWEAENAAYRAKQKTEIPAGTSVKLVDTFYDEGTVKGVASRSQTAGLPGPRSDYYSVRTPGGGNIVIHRRKIEVLPPTEEMPPGTFVQYVSPQTGAKLFEAEVIDPATVKPSDYPMMNVKKKPGPDYVLVHAPAIPGKQARFRAWVSKRELTKMEKK
jgi:hypothetical protein